MTWKLLPNFRPLGATAAWMAAAEAQEGQCGHVGKPRRIVGGTVPGLQCQRFINGGEKMYLSPDGVLLCGTHHDRDRLDRKKEASCSSSQSHPAF